MIFDLDNFENSKFKIRVSTIRQEKPKGVLVVFPGAGYSCMGPCLYYPSNFFLEKGFDIINFEYDFRENHLEDNSQDSYSEYNDFLFDCLTRYDLPDKKIALCKSIGTRIIASNNNKQVFSEIIWMTPDLQNDFVYQEMMESSTKSMVVIGTADPYYDEFKISALKKSGMRCHITLKADHSLDVVGSVEDSLHSMQETVRWIKNNTHVISACV